MRFLFIIIVAFSIPLAGCNVHTGLTVDSFGAVNDGITKSTAAFQKALDQCAAAGGGVVRVPAGKYLIGSIRMSSATTLFLEQGAVLIGSPDPEDYPIVPVRFEGETVQGYQALISAVNANHISIQGPGVIQGDSLIGDLRRPRAPIMIEFENCQDIRLQDFADRYRRMWSIHLLFCLDVQVKNLNIRSTKTNGDGIDIDSSRNVEVANCDIDTGDDCIALKSGRGEMAAKEHRPACGIYIHNCTLGSNFAGVGIGTEMSGGIEDVRIEHCIFTRGDNAIFLKSRLGRGGFIRNVTADDLDTSSKTCLGINLVNKGIVGSDPIAGTAGVPSMGNIQLDHVAIHTGAVVDGLNIPIEKPVDGLTVADVTGTCEAGITLANVTHANIHGINVTGCRGPLLITQNVTGTGLEGAVPPGPAGMAQLLALFASPPDDARPMVRWWWFGPAVTKTELGREIASMKAVGFGGFEIQPTYPLAVNGKPSGLVNLPFLSPEFLDALKYAATTAKESGMRMDLTLGSGWPYGGAMFPIKEAAGCLRVVRATTATTRTTVAQAPSLRAGETIIAAFAGNQEIRITNDSVVLPIGDPRPVTYFISSHTGMKVKRPAQGAEGYVLDHLSLPVVSKFISEIGNKEVEACGSNPPYSVFCDSLEVGGEDWTDNFLAEFQKRRGYDLRPLLPALIQDSSPKGMEIRHDWGQTLTELFNDSFVKPLRSLAEDHKIRFRIQAYGSPSAGLFSYGDADLPEGEGYQWHGYRATRYASSACHLMGVPVCSSETFTWLHGPVFRATPLDIKAEADLHFLQGVNQIICHGWPYTAEGVPDPGWSFYAAAVFDHKNPWYIAMPDVNRYLTRVSSMMRQGRPANDVALYLANDDAWAHFTPGHISLSDGVGAQLGPRIVGQILDAGYNLDFFDDQMLDRFGRIDGGQIVFGNLGYKAVVLAGVERMPLSTLRKLEAFARAGGIIVATRRLPSVAPGYLVTDADNQEVQSFSKRLFQQPGATGIFVEDESKLAAALATRLAPDLLLDPATPQVGGVHRHTDYAEIYFLANTSNKPHTFDASFRVQGMHPQKWNPVTDKITPLAVASRGTGSAAVHLTLDAYESTIIVWTSAKSAVENSRTPINSIDLSTDWTVQFGTDSKPEPMHTLHSWTDDAATRNFSGVSTYRKHMVLPADSFKSGSTMLLTFGFAAPVVDDHANSPGNGFRADLDPPVHEAAIVRINGHRAGAVWCPPYQLDVTRWVNAGENDIQIEVANTAVNALAKDGFPNYDLRAIRNRFGDRFNPPAAAEFQPVTSGLLGPIRLEISR